MEFQKDGGLSSVILIYVFRKVQGAFETHPKVAPPSESKFTNQRDWKSRYRRSCNRNLQINFTEYKTFEQTLVIKFIKI